MPLICHWACSEAGSRRDPASKKQHFQLKRLRYRSLHQNFTSTHSRLPANCAHWAFYNGHDVDLPELAANMVGLNGALAPTLDANRPLWSLSYEIWFYIFGGACAVLTRRPLGAILALAACSVVFSILTASLLLCWAFGALMVLALDVPRKGLLFMVGLAVVAAGVVFLQLSAGSKFFGIASVSYVSPDVARTLLCIGASLQLPYLCSADVDHAPASVCSAGAIRP